MNHRLQTHECLRGEDHGRQADSRQDTGTLWSQVSVEEHMSQQEPAASTHSRDHHHVGIQA